MAITLPQLKTLIDKEYDHLVRLLCLKPAQLDVYVVTETQTFTSLGTDTRNATAGYVPSATQIILPVPDGSLSDCSDRAPEFLPANWDPYGSEWPWWRIELWHEVVHQYQHETLHMLDPDDGLDGHGVGWKESIAAVATAAKAREADVAVVI